MIINKKTPADVQLVHEDTDFRILFAGITEVGEFQYTHGGVVKPGMEYHIHYTNNKEEVFMTGGAHTPSSKIIYKIGGTRSNFLDYIFLKGSESKMKYPKNISRIPTPSEYRIGYFTRFFARKVISTNASIIEVSQSDYEEQNNLFEYIRLQWTISGDKLAVGRENSKTLRSMNLILPGIKQFLNIYQHWRPAIGSQDYLEKKLSLRRIP